MSPHGLAITGVACNEDPAYGISGTSSDAGQLVFWDSIHPTQHTLAALTGYFSSIIEAPGLISTLSQVPLSAGRDHQRSVEDGLPRSSSMRFSGQDHDSVIASFGLFRARILTTRAGDLEVNGLLARDFELQSKDQDRVEAGLVTLAGSRFRMPAIPLQDDAWKASVGVTAKLSDRLGVNANYTWRRDDDYATEQYVGIGMNLKL